jgi:stalled ribosome alternative rescue factor ArfA
MPARSTTSRKAKPRKRNGIAAALKFFKPKTVRSRKGTKAYRRKSKHPQRAE